MSHVDRRDFLKIAGVGVAFASGLGLIEPAQAADQDFFFVQMTDTHWGFKNPQINPEAHQTLHKAVAAVNALPQQPDFIMFSGDLTHTTDDPQERRRRLAEFRSIVAGLHVKDVRFMPGEHDAALDRGEAYKELFGPLHYSFDHKGVHFIALDNTSDPGASLGAAQIEWLAQDLKGRDRDRPIVVFAHRPLFDLLPEWDWATRDGAAAMEVLMPFRKVTVFYGHIHQTHQHMTGHIPHYAGASLIFPLIPPNSAPKRAPVPWDASAPYRGLGFRNIEAGQEAGLKLQEHPLAG
jgi:hypothetical protein